MHRLPTRQPLRVAQVHTLARSFAARFAFFAALASWVYSPFFRLASGMNTFHDAQFLSAYERHARLTVLGYHELPLWDPFTCGGMYGVGAPQARFASPFFLLSLWLGVDRGSVVIVLLSAALGMEGMYRYLRARGADLLLATLFAPIAAWGGFALLAVRLGWIQFASLMLLPWLLLGMHGVARGRAGATRTFATSVALCLGIGGTYTLPMAALPLLIEWCEGLAGHRKHWRAILRATLLAFLLSVLLSAYRWLPLVEELHASTRVMAGRPMHSLQEIGALLFPWLSENLGRCEFMVGAAALWALPGLGARRARPALMLLALAVALAAGCFAPWAPFVWLRKLPVYDTLRYPERYLAFVPFSLSVLAALGGSRLLGRAGRRAWGVAAVYALACGGLITSVVQAQGLAAEWSPMVALRPSPAESTAEFRQARGNRWLASEYLELGRGTLACGEAYALPMSPRLRGDLPAEEYAVPAEAGTVQRISWSPNRIALQANLVAPGQVVINQNAHPGWTTDVGQRIEYGGLLAIALPAGAHTVHLKFQPRSWFWGASASLAGLAFVVVSHRRRERVGEPLGNRTLLGVTLCTAALVGMAFMLMRARPAVPMELADGRALLSDVMPADMQPVGAKFEVPIELGGIRVDEAAAGLWRVQLAWRRTGVLSPELGVTVRMRGERSGNDADHPEFSGRIYPSKAPLNVWVLDEFETPTTPPDSSGNIDWTIGLRNTYGDQRVVRPLAAAHGNASSAGLRITLPAPRVMPRDTSRGEQNP